MPGNEIVVPDPSNPDYPIIGTISPDGKRITWTQQGIPIQEISRWDVDECTVDPANDPCAYQTGTICYNTDPGFTCNCDVVGVWSTADGSYVQVSIDSTTTPKVAVMYTMADGTATTGTLLGNTIEFLNSDGSEKIGIITKNVDGIGGETITWDDGTGWGRVPDTTGTDTTGTDTTDTGTTGTGTTGTDSPNPECGPNEHWVECDSCTENDCKHGMACLMVTKKCANNWSACCIIQQQCVCNQGYARYTGDHFYQTKTGSSKLYLDPYFPELNKCVPEMECPQPGTQECPPQECPPQECSPLECPPQECPPGMEVWYHLNNLFEWIAHWYQFQYEL